jgi:hypothetical protein
VSDRSDAKSARYVIRVRGLLAPDWSPWFAGFAIEHVSDGDTILSGEVIDESAFYGLISRARDLGLTIVSIERQERPRDDTSSVR